MRVSVLVPIYGVEKYIDKCVRSLFEQTMKEGIEFIFTDDCTPDNSISILKDVLKEYPERESQVSIIHHERNKGLAVARVTGLTAAKGEYVIHCDSDDWVEPDMYEHMYHKAKETDADIVGCDFFEEIDGCRKIVSQNFLLSSKDAALAILRSQSGLDSFLWCRMVKRKFYVENNFIAPPEVSIFEDLVVTVPMHLKASVCSKIDRPLYHYRRWSGGMTYKSTVKGILSALDALNLVKDSCQNDLDLFNAYRKRFLNMAQALITQEETYEPVLWRDLTANIPLKLFGSIKHQISPWLVRHKMDALNSILVRLYRRR